MEPKKYLSPKRIVLTAAILVFFAASIFGPIYCEEVAHVCPPDIYEIMMPVIFVDIAIMLPMYALSSVLDPAAHGLFYLVVELLWAYLIAVMLVSMYERIKRVFSRKKVSSS